MLVGYARCSTDAQDLTAQRDALTALGVKPNRIYVDHASPAPTERAQVCAKRSPPAAPATPWSSPNSTGSPAPSPMPATLSRNSPRPA